MTGGAPREVLVACDATRAFARLGPRRADVALEAVVDESVVGDAATAVNESTSDAGMRPTTGDADMSRVPTAADCAATGAEANVSAAIAAQENRTYTFIDFPPEQKVVLRPRDGKNWAIS